MDRCANTEAIDRYLRECDEKEKIYENDCNFMYEELDEVIDIFEDIAKRYGLRDEAEEYVRDKI